MHEREGPAHALALEVNVQHVAVGEDERFVVLVLQVVQHGVSRVATLLKSRQHHALLPQISHVSCHAQITYFNGEYFTERFRT